MILSPWLERYTKIQNSNNLSDLIWIIFSIIGVKINKEILQVRQSKFLP